MGSDTSTLAKKLNEKNNTKISSEIFSNC